MNSKWYSQQYLGKSFDRFLKSDMNSIDFKRLQEVLQQVSAQLQLREDFIKSGSINRTGKTHIRTNVLKGNLVQNRSQR